MAPYPLKKLDGLPMGTFFLRLSRVEPMRMSGWRRFSVHLVDPVERRSDLPLLDGIFSRGGKGIQPWIEIAAYHPEPTFEGSHAPNLREGGLESDLFRYLHDILEPGSHLMLWYEGESGRETDLALTRRIPPLLTPMGLILFEAGFSSVRDFHLPEGGHEGGRKLWGERPPDREVEIEWVGRAFDEAMAYFFTPLRVGLLDLELDARERAILVFERSLSLWNDPESSTEPFENLRAILDGLRRGDLPVETWPGPAEKHLEQISPG